MRIIKSINQTCFICGEVHNLLSIQETTVGYYKGVEIVYDGVFDFCDRANEMYESEEWMSANRLSMIDVYRKTVGLLSSKQIIAIRDHYKISQKDFAEVLEWGLATITRHETDQVQDRIHDDVLRKLDEDPLWFIQLLKRSKEKFSEKTYQKYMHAARERYEQLREHYVLNASISFNQENLMVFETTDNDIG